MKNVLHVIGYIGWGGDSSIVFDAMKGLEGTDVHFDFVTHQGAKEETVAALRSSGSAVYIMDGDVRELGILNYYRQLLAILKQAGTVYDAIHVHTCMQSGVALWAAESAGIPVRICHSHTTSIQRNTSWIKKAIAVPVFRYLFMKYSTKRVGCSKAAGRFLFGDDKNYELIYNGVDIDKYISVTEADVKNAKIDLGLNEEDIVVGHVARFCDLKNQSFDIELAKSLFKTLGNDHIRFVLVGTGENYEKTKEEAKEFGDKFIFTGYRSDIPVLMKAFDLVILPSLSEGFPVTIMEAQAAGCRCIISNFVTNEAEVGLGLVKQLPLADTHEWVNTIKNTEKITDMQARNNTAEKLRELGFDKASFVKKWIALYD